MNPDDLNFEFAYVWVFGLLILPILVFFFLPALKKRKSSLITSLFFKTIHATGIKPQDKAWISKRNLLQWLLVSLAFILLIGSLASPQLVGQPQLKVKTARSFLIVSDISFSMDIRDWVKNEERLSRWEAVKQVMKSFIDTRESDKLGLIFFGTNPYLQAPLTTDLEVITWMLDETEVGMAGQTTAIGDAIGMGIEVLKADTLEEKVMLLLTDGVDAGQGIMPLDAANLAKGDSVTIYTLGIGDPKAQSADLDEKTLIEIAEATGGQYFRAIDQEALEQAYAVLNQLEPVEYEEEDYQPKVLLYHYPLGSSLLLILFQQLIQASGGLIKGRRSNAA